MSFAEFVIELKSVTPSMVVALEDEVKAIGDSSLLFQELTLDLRSVTAFDLESSDLFANQTIDQDSDLVNRLSHSMKKVILKLA
ncbi:2062_t:CDS:2 [Cetraspora pellucida]|uniref:2062_t:CDS:1 n=1 Tax=Cetraspora pellucida TaxID=1433469 RepID=A0A9N9NNM5_9GLOM|nr:2062_t:CDS:2 [Cetraspora pellucida]